MDSEGGGRKLFLGIVVAWDEKKHEKLQPGFQV
jgi:hypothetical protein